MHVIILDLGRQFRYRIFLGRPRLTTHAANDGAQSNAGAYVNQAPIAPKIGVGLVTQDVDSALRGVWMDA